MSREADPIGRERRRLKRAFGAALLAAALPPAAMACSTSNYLLPRLDASSADTGSAAEASATESDASSEETTDATVSDVSSEAYSFDCAALIYLDATLTDAQPDAQVCGVFLPCGLPPNLIASGCTIYSAPSMPICQVVEDAGCHDDAIVAEAGNMLLNCACDVLVGGGRRTRGTRRPRPREARDVVGAALAVLATEEAASVGAFERLERELSAHGAPPRLAAKARRARADEVRHARVMTRWARRHGASPALVPERSRPVRPLAAVVRENLVEGCVRETYGALVASWQARHAADPAMRQAFARIAADETEHAALAWAVARWADDASDESFRRGAFRAATRAVRALRRTSTLEPHPALVASLGLPPAATAEVLVDAVADLVKSLRPRPLPATLEASARF